MTVDHLLAPTAEHIPLGEALFVDPSALDLACAAAAARRVSRVMASESRTRDGRDALSVEPVRVRQELVKDIAGHPERVGAVFAYPDGMQADLTIEERERVLMGYAAWGVRTHNRGLKNHAANNQAVLDAWRGHYKQSRNSMEAPDASVVDAMWPVSQENHQRRLVRMPRAEYLIMRLASQSVPGAIVTEVMIDNPRTTASAVEALIAQYEMVGKLEGHYTELKPFDRLAAHHAALSMIENIRATGGQEALVAVTQERQPGQAEANFDDIYSATQDLNNKINELDARERRQPYITDEHVRHAKSAEETRAIAFVAALLTSAASK